MKNKLTVSIGIPTFNGAANIGNLLSDLLILNYGQVVLDSITVHADGCTDGTQELVKKLSKKHSIIKLIDTKVRGGKSNGVNNLFNSFHTDIAIILDDDIRVSDPDFVWNMCKPIASGIADLVSCPISPVVEKGVISRALRAGMSLKENAIRNLNHSQNIYACRGPVRAHSKSLYKHLSLSSKALGDDMYTYLYAKTHGFKFLYTTDTLVYFQVPVSISDHRKQSIRFMQSQEKIEKEFNKEFVRHEFSVPLLFKLQQVIKTLPSEHMFLLVYLALYSFNWVQHKLFTVAVKDDKWNRIVIKAVKVA